LNDIVILGGPNGAGKTTAARQLIPSFTHIQEFLNASRVASRREVTEFLRTRFAVDIGLVLGIF